MGTFEELMALVPPPTAPLGAAGDWVGVEAALGLRLPIDYKALVKRYGWGGFGEITLLTPFAPPGRPWGDLLRHARDLSGFPADPEDFPGGEWFQVYPAPGGLLQWGETALNGELLCWETVGEPDDWTVVVWDPGCLVRRHRVGVVEFLYGHLSGQRVAPELAAPAAVPWFDPYLTLAHVYIRVSDGDRPYEEQLRILRAALAPTADRGGGVSHDGVRRDHFKAIDRDWQLIYENPGNSVNPGNSENPGNSVNAGNSANPGSYGNHQNYGNPWDHRSAAGRTIRVAFPAEDSAEARAVLLTAIEAMGCTPIEAQIIHGNPIWPDAIPLI